MKRIVSLILALLLTLSSIPAAPARAAENTDIRSTVTQAYNELAATLNPGESAYDGTLQLLSHALFGNGEDIIMDEDDYFSGLAFGSNMFKEGFIEGLTAAFERLTNNYDQEMLVSGSYQFYDHRMSYTYTTVSFFMDIPLDDGSGTLNPSGNGIEQIKYVEAWNGARNSGDEALMLVAGSCLTNYTITKTSVSDDSADYHIDIVFRDNFDFGSGNYQGNDAQLAKALTWIGKLMQFGAIVHPFHWEVHLEFDISFDNTCPHQSEIFRWEYNGTDIVAVPGDGLSISNTTRIQTVDSQGQLQNPYFRLDKTVTLDHDKPWVLEFRWSGYKISFSPSTTWMDCQPYLIRSTNHLYGSQGFARTEIDEESGNEVTYKGEDLYTVPGDTERMGYKRTELHTYRLENRVASDGSNMVYLYIDGDNLGPMTYNYVSYRGTLTDMHQDGDWFNGVDFKINYIHNAIYRMVPYQELEYIQIWQNGDTNEPYSYYTTSTVAPICTGKGYTAHVCSQCGDTWKDNFVDPLGHRFGDWEAKDDTLHSRVCSVCGDEEMDAHSWGENGDCTVCGHTVSISIAGEWTTDLVMPAADLGVSAPDAVLRATLAFSEDGSASCSWEAVDLTAFRIFFHDMFVNSYYALGYGLGITNFEEIEILCRESTGMGVSEYMDTIVTDEAITAAFTPASTSGIYSYNADHSALLTDLPIMEIPSDPSIENSFVLGGDTLYLNAASWDKPDYTFVCTRK